jgi:hypothetical protein
VRVRARFAAEFASHRASLVKRGMDRLRLVAACAALLPIVSCAAFKDKRTPSGEFCSDMPIIPAGQEPDREYHRLQPIASDPKMRTEAERLESLRKVACGVGADAVIEAVNEEVRGDNAQYQMVSSGTAVIWLRRTGAADKPPPASAPQKKVTPIGAAPEPTAAPTAEPPPKKTPIKKPSRTPIKG